MKKLTHLWFLLALLILGRPALAEKTPLETVLPQDAWFALIIDDIPQSRAAWKNHPLARMWNDPQIQKFLAPMLKEMSTGAEAEKTFTARTGKNFEEALAMLQGGIAMAMTELPADAFSGPAFNFDVDDEEAEKMSLQGLSRIAIRHGMRYLNTKLAARRSLAAPPSQVPGLIFIIDTASGKEAQEMINRMMKHDIEKNNLLEDVEDYRGVHMTVIKDRNPDVRFQACFAVAGNLAMMSTQPADLKKTIDRIQDKAAGAALDKSPTFQQVRQQVGKTDAIAFVDISRLLKVYEEGMEKARGGKPEQPNPLIPGGTKAVFKAMGFDAMRGLYLSMKMHETHTDLSYGLTYTEDRGLMKLFAAADGPVQRPSFIPANVIQVDSVRFSINGFYKGIMQIVNDLAPAAVGMVQANLAQLKNQTNVDIEKDILGNLGDDLVSINFPIKTDKPRDLENVEDSIRALSSSTIMISLKDKQGFETAFHSIIGALMPGGDPFEKKQYLGHTIFTIKGGDAPSSFAFTDKWLLFGMASSEGIENLLISMGRQDPGIWDKPEVKAAMEMLPKDSMGISWSDLGAVMAALTSTLHAVSELAPGDGLSKIFDFKATPDAKLFSSYITGVSAGMNKDAKAIRVLNRMHHKPAANP